MTDQPRIELAWVNMSERRPPRPGRYLTRRDLAVQQLKHGLRNITTITLDAHWDGEGFNTPVQPDYWRDLPADFSKGA